MNDNEIRDYRLLSAFVSFAEFCSDKERYMATAARVRAFEASVQRGIADADAGRTKPAQGVFVRLTEKYSDL
jgi:predicted transcriptional regulator